MNKENKMTEEIQCEEVQKSVEQFRETFTALREEVSKFIVGQEDVINKVLISIVAGGHVLLEGVPGLGKTALVNTISKVLHLNSKRIQFTPDLLPADILGTNIMVERKGEKVFDFQKGPVFTNILLADEINRATPKTQSALLETMQEKTVTVANTTHRLDLPYFVLATQNPLEMDGTYPLPEAQLDRFFFKLNVLMPNHDEFSEILSRTTGVKEPKVEAVTNGETILEMGLTARQVPIAEEIKNYLISLAIATHPEKDGASSEVKKYVRYGVSPRAAQTILLAAKINALINNRYHVSRKDVNEVAIPAMRHRMLLSFEGEAEGITTEQIINNIITNLNK